MGKKNKFKLWESLSLPYNKYWDFALFVKGEFHIIMWGRDNDTYFLSLFGTFPIFFDWLVEPEV